MANRTDKEAATIHGTNPQNLVENIVRQKIYQTIYWKESCFALTAELLIEKAVDLKAVGGTYGGQNAPTHFLCLILKMLQIQPDKEIIIEYIKNEDFKYVRLLGAFYMRLVGRPLEVYQYLEPLYNDYRKIRIQLPDGSFALSHMDAMVDDMLRKDYMFDIALPRIPKRLTLENSKQLDPRLSVLDAEFDEAALEQEAGEAAKQAAEAAAASIANRDGLQHASARSGRDEDEERAEKERAKERQREKWREDPKDSRREDRGRDKEKDSRDYGEDDEYDRRRHRDRDGYDDRDRDRGSRRQDRDDDRDKRRGARSESPDRDRRRRERSPDRDHRGHGRESRDEHSKRPSAQAGAGGKSRAVDLSDPEIIAANLERAKLGLKPLK